MSTAAGQPPVSIVMVSYDAAPLLDDWIAAVRTSDYPDVQVIAVDNRSTDDSLARLRAMGDVRVIDGGGNLGFGGGCNVGAEHAEGELLLFMNPDVALHPDTVSLLVTSLLSTPDAAIICPTHVGPGSAHTREDRVEDVAAMAGATMLITREHFRAIGGFDPWIFLYFEDTDLCFRTCLAGKRVLKAWGATAGHVPGAGSVSSRFIGEQIKNGIYVHLKTRAWPDVARQVALMAAKTVLSLVRRRDRAVLDAWIVNARELRTTLAKRRAILGAAAPCDQERLERLGAEHAYWARRARRARARAAVQARLPLR